MKKHFLLAAMLVFLLLSGCGSGADTTTGGENQGVTETQQEEDYLNENEFIQMYTDPDAFKGRKVDFNAVIFMPVEKDADGTYIQAFTDPINSERNTIIASDDPNLDVEEGDIIHVVGTVEGTFTGQNLFGAEITAPIIVADTIEKTDWITAFAPAIETITVGETIDQHGYQITLDKIELAENETRVYLTIANNTKNNISFLSYNSKLILGNKQYGLSNDFNLYADYKEPDSDLLPGIVTDGILTFPAISKEEANSLKVYLEGLSDDWNIDLEPFVFEVSW